MSYIGYFLDEHKALCKPKIVAVEDDWNFICTIFPEPGFRSYFCGHIISRLAKQLKQNGINTYYDRESRPEFTSLTGFLSHIQLVGEENCADDRRGIGNACEEGEGSAGESTNSTFSPLRGSTEGEERNDSKEAGPVIVRLVTNQKFPFSADEVKKALMGDFITE